MKEHHCHSFVHCYCELKATKHAVLLVSNEEIIYHDCFLLPLKVSSFLSNDQESDVVLSLLRPTVYSSNTKKLSISGLF